MIGLRGLRLGNKTPLRVAAYCRVSTEGVQDESFEEQLKFFMREISDHPGWEFAGIYADHAKTATQVKGRPDFLRMMNNARAHRFDFIVTKSISRFSRSVSDTMKYLRELTDLGIGVYFMEECFDTMTVNGEIVISVLASVAEMESESISQNIKMVLDAKNEMGTPLRKCAYGYKRAGENWIPDPKKAVRVKLAFLMVAHGYGFTEIANRLNQFEEADGTRKEWTSSQVRSMLQNEAYAGDILTNKTVLIRDKDGKRQVKNDNLADKFYIDHHHDPMVGRELYQKVNGMLNDKKLAGQDDFCGLGELRTIARNDHLLDSVRKLLPSKPGKWMMKERVYS